MMRRSNRQDQFCFAGRERPPSSLDALVSLIDWSQIITSASENDDDVRWVKPKGKRAVHGFKAHVAPMQIRGWSRKSRSHPPISMMARLARKPYRQSGRDVCP